MDAQAEYMRRVPNPANKAGHLQAFNNQLLDDLAYNGYNMYGGCFDKAPTRPEAPVTAAMLRARKVSGQKPAKKSAPAKSAPVKSAPAKSASAQSAQAPSARPKNKQADSRKTQDLRSALSTALKKANMPAPPKKDKNPKSAPRLQAGPSTSANPMCPVAAHITVHSTTPQPSSKRPPMSGYTGMMGITDVNPHLKFLGYKFASFVDAGGIQTMEFDNGIYKVVDFIPGSAIFPNAKEALAALCPRDTTTTGTQTSVQERIKDLEVELRLLKNLKQAGHLTDESSADEGGAQE